MPIISKETDMEDYVSFEQAKKLKELGFDWKTYCAYDKIYKDDRPWELRNYHTPQNHNLAQYSASAPTMSQAQKWLREKHYLSIEVYSSLDGDNQWEWHYYVQDLNDHLERPADATIHCDGYQSYEQALSAGIDKALELLKQTDNEHDSK